MAVGGVPPGGTTTDAEKLAFGNETEFANTPISEINTLVYAVFTGQDTAGTLPGIAIEANDPDGAFSFTSLVYLPSASMAPSAPATPANNTWQIYQASAAGSQWFATGAGGTETGCTLGAPCTFDALKAALPPNTIVSFSLGFSKGRDDAWVGALDCLVVNELLYDFEVKKIKRKKAKKFLEGIQ